MDWSLFWLVLLGMPVMLGVLMLVVTGLSHLIAKIVDDERVGFAILFGLFLVGMAVAVGLTQ